MTSCFVATASSCSIFIFIVIHIRSLPFKNRQKSSKKKRQKFLLQLSEWIGNMEHILLSFKLYEGFKKPNLSKNLKIVFVSGGIGIFILIIAIICIPMMLIPKPIISYFKCDFFYSRRQQSLNERNENLLEEQVSLIYYFDKGAS